MDELLQQIGAAGDRLWAKTLPARDENGLLPLENAPPALWSLCHIWFGRLDRGELSLLGGVAIVVLIPLMLVVDLLNLIFRIVFYLPVLLVWKIERRLAIWRRRRVFCPTCQQEMTDPWVYCRAKGCRQRVQPMLRPHLNSLFIRRCQGCGKSSWRILSQWRGAWPTPLVCRHTKKVMGCYHPIGIAAFASGTRVAHVAVAGTDALRKHEVLSRLAAWLVGIGVAGRHYWPAWPGSELEMKWFRGLLEGSTAPTDDSFEQPGKHYPLAYAFTLESSRAPVLAFHNLPNAWIQNPDDMAVRGCNWGAMQHLLLVVDPGSWAKGSTALPGAEVLARLLRDAEEYGSLTPGAWLEVDLTICLAIAPEEQAEWADLLDAEGGMTAANVERVLREHAPALLALARQMVRPRRLHLVGGLVRQGGAAVKPAWVAEIGRRLVQTR